LFALEELWPKIFLKYDDEELLLKGVALFINIVVIFLPFVSSGQEVYYENTFGTPIHSDLNTRIDSNTQVHVSGSTSIKLNTELEQRKVGRSILSLRGKHLF